jgi:hypothetical protein
MKAFLSSVAAAVAIAVVAAVILMSLDWSTADVYQSSHGSVRL